MNKEQLEQLSDFMLNVAITEVLNNESYKEWAVTADKTAVYHCGFDGSQYHSVDIVDYCSSPSDMMPLVFEGKVTLSPIQPYTEEHDPSLWCASCEVDSGAIECWHKNPLRAAAIAYLLMKEGG